MSKTSLIIIIYVVTCHVANAFTVSKVEVPPLLPQSHAPSIPATLYLPAASGPRPALVILHTCGGIDGDVIRWGEDFASRDYTVIIPDSFGARGKNNCSDGRQIQRWERVSDAYSAAAFLKRLPSPRIGKIGLLGFSYGGGTTINIALNDSGNELFQAAVAFYPATLADQAFHKPNMPLLVTYGENDTEIDRPALKKWAQEDGNTGLLSFVTYANTWHRFDHPGPRYEVRTDPRGVSHSRGYNEVAASDARSRTLRFFDQRLGK